MDKELLKWQEEKTREARDFFDKYDIRPISDNGYFSIEHPDYSEDSNPDKTETKFHWTRLSINSSIGCVIE